jgi:hypothetical protein
VVPQKSTATTLSRSLAGCAGPKTATITTLPARYLLRFAQEAAWREDHRREPNGAQVDRVVALAMRNKPSVDFCGYWQRHQTIAQPIIFINCQCN